MTVNTVRSRLSLAALSVAAAIVLAVRLIDEAPRNWLIVLAIAVVYGVLPHAVFAQSELRPKGAIGAAVWVAYLGFGVALFVLVGVTCCKTLSASLLAGSVATACVFFGVGSIWWQPTKWR
jgi:O-antigen/teichoic acid export membrane protein